ncbi:hypothetical protein FJ661_16035 [Pseudarthrobacter phenanthrenivorans]|nr:hypothetical protein FJ661_16035 [Pseudarthrobacter phenanthrenivorans]
MAAARACNCAAVPLGPVGAGGAGAGGAGAGGAAAGSLAGAGVGAAVDVGAGSTEEPDCCRLPPVQDPTIRKNATIAAGMMNRFFFQSGLFCPSLAAGLPGAG